MNLFFENFVRFCFISARSGSYPVCIRIKSQVIATDFCVNCFDFRLFHIQLSFSNSFGVEARQVEIENESRFTVKFTHLTQFIVYYHGIE